MKRLSHYVFDTYDDVDGQILKSAMDNPAQLPGFVKSASRLTPIQIQNAPDDQFALVLFDGTDKLKKYATVDKGNTTLSVLYLLKQAWLLPPQAVKIAASNLIDACQYHGLSVPAELLKAAQTGISPVSGKSQSPYAKKGKVEQVQYPAILEEPREFHDNPQLGKADGAWDDVKERTNVEGSPGSNFLELPVFPQKEKIKTAGQVFNGLGGTSPELAVEQQNLFTGAASTRQQSWRETPYFDISGWDPSMAGVPDTTIPERTLMDGSYPIDGYDQVKTASAYFNMNYKDLPPRDRHQYCTKLAARMTELHMEVPEAVTRYGSTTYASDVESYVEARRTYVLEDAHSTLDMLLEKRAQVSPQVFANALEEFDRMNNLNWHWDAQIADPWYSTFGPSLEKVADDNWRYDAVGTRVSEHDLERIARNAHPRIAKSFGHEFARDFAKSPKSYFMGLSDEKKLMLARLASDQHNGTYTE